MNIPTASIFRGLTPRIQPFPQKETVETQSDENEKNVLGGFQELKLSPSFFEEEDDELPGSSADHLQLYYSEEKTPDTSENEREVLLYLIRHGEAEHNVLEKIAMQKALERSIQETGKGKEYPETVQKLEDARKAVLNNETLKDAKLSELGRWEAHTARTSLWKINLQTGLEPPARVLVSPLTRTLETASILFPEHHNTGLKVHVREDLSERKTGKPPDTRSSVTSLSLRKSFRRFSMNQLIKNESVLAGDADKSMPESRALEETSLEPNACSRKRRRHLQSGMEENREELRKRTHRLFCLLAETNHSSVAVVTHKGYLRELEKGPLRQGDTVKEFKNCEIRVYNIKLVDHQLVQAERVH